MTDKQAMFSIHTINYGEEFDDRYRIIDKCGEGGGGSVWRAKYIGEEDNKIGKEFALKCIAVSKKELNRLIREVHKHAKLPQHKHILPCLDAFGDHGYCVLVLPLAELSLHEVIIQNHAIHEPLFLLFNVADAVHELHKNGIWHGDIKAANVLLFIETITANEKREFIPRLADFGVQRTSAEYAVNADFPTPKDNMEKKIAWDAFALGVLGFFLLVGSLPEKLQNQRSLQKWQGLTDADSEQLNTALDKQTTDEQSQLFIINLLDVEANVRINALASITQIIAKLPPPSSIVISLETDASNNKHDLLDKQRSVVRIAELEYKQKEYEYQVEIEKVQSSKLERDNKANEIKDALEKQREITSLIASEYKQIKSKFDIEKKQFLDLDRDFKDHELKNTLARKKGDEFIDKFKREFIKSKEKYEIEQKSLQKLDEEKCKAEETNGFVFQKLVMGISAPPTLPPPPTPPPPTTNTLSWRTWVIVLLVVMGAAYWFGPDINPNPADKEDVDKIVTFISEPEAVIIPPLIEYGLTIIVDPADAHIRLLEPDRSYHAGMKLEAGSYEIEVSKDGYQSKREIIEIIDNDVEPKINLELIQYALTVLPEPADARIRILNIKPIYSDGIMLVPASYRISVSKSGYRSYNKEIEITDRDVEIELELERLLPSIKMVFIPAGEFMM
ncbi:MAG: protein kinase, partial [Mariprofundales bacterium]